jgi:hypothetical protein
VGEDGGHDKAYAYIAPSRRVVEVRKVTLTRRYPGSSKTLVFFLKIWVSGWIQQAKDGETEYGAQDISDNHA